MLMGPTLEMLLNGWLDRVVRMAVSAAAPRHCLAARDQPLALAPVVHAGHDALVLAACGRFDIEGDQPCFQLRRVNLDSDFFRPLRHKQIPNDLLAQFSCGLFIEGN